eukprot:TRINITY_DN2469_c0_g1_i1.p1 TRINITY_DN2469_c0_g1~~TRINITY_DN2469_c0_g1_i1.p1  ORF type:complete len:454 (+),score=154.66 TRINITY_DN2469_c0_g1_i1:91-1452(+)
MKLVLVALVGCHLALASNRQGVRARVSSKSSLEKARELPPDPSVVTLPDVPDVQNAGIDGVPVLPDVSQILDGSRMLGDISSKAREFEAKANKMSVSNAKRLAQQKLAFDQKLKEQELTNQDMQKANAELAARTLVEKKAAEALYNELVPVRKAGDMRRNELRGIKEQLAAVMQMIDETLAKADESKVPELAVLHIEETGRKESAVFEEAKKRAASQDILVPVNEAGTHKHEASEEDILVPVNEAGTHKHEASEEDILVPVNEAGTHKHEASEEDILVPVSKAGTRKREASEEDAIFEEAFRQATAEEDSSLLPSADSVAPSFLEVDQETDIESSGEETEHLLSVLSQGVQKIKLQGEASQKKLKDLFMDNYKAGVKRRKALKKQEDALHRTMAKMVDYKGRLGKARTHLEASLGLLELRTTATSKYLAKLSQLASARPEVASAALATLQHGH